MLNSYAIFEGTKVTYSSNIENNDIGDAGTRLVSIAIQRMPLLEIIYLCKFIKR